MCCMKNRTIPWRSLPLPGFPDVEHHRKVSREILEQYIAVAQARGDDVMERFWLTSWNTMHDGNTTYAYDRDGQLTGATRSNTTSADESYAYDNSGNRTSSGDITDDDLLNNIGDVALGIETAYFYSAAHPSEKNKTFVEGVKRASNGMRANFFGVSGYDGMHLIYAAMTRTGGKTDGDSFIGAVKGMSWESPRGPMTIDPETRDVIHNIYLRRVEKRNGELWNIEFATVENVKDPVKAARK